MGRTGYDDRMEASRTRMPRTAESLPADRSSRAPATTGRRGSWVPWAWTTATYSVLSLVVWWNVWTSHPTSTTTCGCGDASLFTWFLEWPAYALEHGNNPFYSTAMFHPTGINLLANTSVEFLGIPLIPVTWIFGPVATLNVAFIIAPVLSGLAMFALLRRWVSWAPAACIGGLLYGFSPFILSSLSQSWLMLGFAAVPPLIVICLDELMITQRRRPVVVGVVLGLLVVSQFFIGTEQLVITVISTAVGLGLVCIFVAIVDLEGLRRHARVAVVGCVSALATAGVLLAYPAWFALAGPGHYSGPVWQGLGNPTYSGTALGSFVRSATTPSTVMALYHLGGGYQGLLISNQYFGVTLLLVVIAGIAIWRRDRRLWLFGGIACATAILSLGAIRGSWRPWQLTAHVPLLQNIIANRFVGVTWLAVAIILAVIVDHVHAWSTLRFAADGNDGHPRRRQWAGALAATLVAVLAVSQVTMYLIDRLPMTAEPVVLPTWFRTVAPHLEGHQVLLVLPTPFSFVESAMTWQAVNRLHYSIVGGGGPSATLGRAGVERPGQVVISNLSFSFTGFRPGPSDSASVRQALIGWGVTMVVIPVDSGLPPYERIDAVGSAASLITAATGERPQFQAGAWVWVDVQHSVR